VIVMYVLTLLAAGMGMFMMATRGIGTIAIFFCVVLVLILVFRLLGAVRFRETVVRLKRKQAVSRQVKQEVESFEKIELYFQQAKTFEQWWKTVCHAADDMNFVKSSLLLNNRDGSTQILAWEKNDKHKIKHDIVEVNVPVRDRRKGLGLKLKVNVCVNGSVESVGRRIALFGRLLEEYGLVDLPREAKDSSIQDIKDEEPPTVIEQQITIVD